MHCERNLPFLHLASRRGWETFLAITIAMLFFVAVGFLFPAEALGGGRPAWLAPPSPAGPASLPPEALPSISSALGRDLPGYQARALPGGIEADNARQKLAATFTAQGVEVRSGSQRWRIALRGYGYGDALTAVHTVVPRAYFNRVEYRRGALTEWYVNGPLGLEQGITLHERQGQADGRSLTIALALEGDLTATVDEGGTGLTLSSRKGQPELRYKGLFAYDATGRKLPARMEMRGTQLRLEVEDTMARYPVVIDPYVQLAMLTNTNQLANQQLGASVSISGNTAVAGAYCPTCTSPGAAYVFVEPKTGWANMTQTATLSASDGVAGNAFGFAVSISGNTIVVGAHGTNNGQGAAYVFVEPVVGGWMGNLTESAKLTASDGTSNQLLGRSVSISSGNTVVAGSPADTIGRNANQGAAYVFVEPTNGWASMTETAKLIASDGVRNGELGYSVGIDGDTVVAGQPSPLPGALPAEPGTAYVFVKPVAGWASITTQTAELTASDGVNGDRLANFVAVSGITIVAGAPLASITTGSTTVSQQGAAYVFVQPTTGWANMKQTAKLTSTDGTKMGYFGRGVAISGDNVVVGAPGQTVGSEIGQGAAYVFVKPTGGWVNATQNYELDITNGGTKEQVGSRVGISGTTAVIGALGEGSDKQGAAFIFAPQ